MARGYSERQKGLDRRTATVAIRVSPALLARIDAIREHGSIQRSRAEAARDLIEEGLAHWTEGRR